MGLTGNHFCLQTHLASTCEEAIVDFHLFFQIPLTVERSSYRVF